MTFVACRVDGPAIHADIPPTRPRKLTTDQALNHRNALWLFGLEVGFFDPRLGRCRPHSVAEVAALFGRTTQTVRDGVASARAVRALVAEVAAGD